ncbi:MAG: hypothetical protein WBY44_08505 [Bryobacteraceae bacterium]|jgi:hypothetical protein
MTAASIIAAFAWIGFWPLVAAAQDTTVCNPANLQGAYGFQLSGRTTISGDAKPVASMGRVEFDGKGAVTGVSSVNFAGYFLGNPVTGKYEAQTDCSIVWSLQDDSGAWQHFEGKLTPDLLAAQFHQTDPGGAQNGTMQKVASTCSLAGLGARYGFSLSGSAIPMNPGEVPRRISATGLAEPDPAGAIKLTLGDTAGSGTIVIGSDCIAQLTLSLPSGETVVLRGILVDGGKRILTIETDPGTTVTATFTARP